MRVAPGKMNKATSHLWCIEAQLTYSTSVPCWHILSIWKCAWIMGRMCTVVELTTSSFRTKLTFPSFRTKLTFTF